MPEETPGATGTQNEVTPNGEEQSGTESGNQNDLQAQLADLQAKLKDFDALQQKASQLEEENKRNLAEATKWQATYKGLQRQATEKLQRAALLEKQLMDQTSTRQELEAMKQYLGVLASNVLDDESAKKLELTMREASIKAAEERARNPQPQNNQADYTLNDPDEQKRQFLEFYFPESGLDPNNPGIDWAENTNVPQEAFRRFTTSVSKLIQEKRSEAPAQKDISVVLKEQQEQLLAQLKAEQEEFAKNQQKLREDALAEARRETEERLRKMGIDASGTPPPENQRRGATKLREIDEGLLRKGEPGSPERRRAEQEYDRLLAEARKDIFRR